MRSEASEVTPVVSVVVPVYNTAERLPGTLRSLMSQNLKEIEIILVDDGSTDNSLAICEMYAAKDPRIKVVTGPNGGVSVARNKGLDVARGKWIAFCDSDDRVSPFLYTTLLKLAEDEHADLPSCALRDIGPEIRTHGVVDFPIVEDTDTICGRENVMRRAFYPLLAHSPYVHGYLVICLFRRDLVEARHLRFCPGVRVCEDELFMLDYLLSVTTIAVVRKNLYDYVRFDSSASTSYYSRENDFRREYNWFLCARERERIVRAGGLDAANPALARSLHYHVNYHEAQSICCNRATTWKAKMARLRDLRERVRRETVAPAGLSEKILHALLVWFTPLLPLVLWAKRRKDDWQRKCR